MPVLTDSDYKTFWPFTNAHFSTIVPSLFRKRSSVETIRERIDTPDGDFLDLDWYCRNRSERLVILCHGLEGNGKNRYIAGMAKAFGALGWDAVAMNYRGCSGEMNRKLRFYHSGATEDLDVVVQRMSMSYGKISIVGFSLGGNITLKYLGENGMSLNESIHSAAAVSVPVDLAGASRRLNLTSNRIYSARFMKQKYIGT